MSAIIVVYKHDLYEHHYINCETGEVYSQDQIDKFLAADGIICVYDNWLDYANESPNFVLLPWEA